MKHMLVRIGRLLILSEIIRTDVIINFSVTIVMDGRSWNITLKIINRKHVRMEKIAIKEEIVRTITLIKTGGKAILINFPI